MNHALLLSIAAVERDTGLSKDTLRIWEKRYGFPVPVRDGQGERAYPLDQVERLRVIKRLLDVGHRPGRVVALEHDSLLALAERSADALGLHPQQVRRRGQSVADPATPAGGTVRPAHTLPGNEPVQGHTTGLPQDWVDACLDAADQHDLLRVRRLLRQALAQEGAARLVTEVVSPLMRAMGDGWLRGRFQVQQEHAVSQAVQQTLHAAIHQMPLPHPDDRPRVLLSTLPGEAHGLGLLAAEAWLTLVGAQPLNLGPQTPLWDLVQSAQQHRAEVVLLGFSAAAPAPLVQDTLSELRSKVPPHIEVWVGGQHPLLQRKPPAHITVLSDIADLGTAVQRWRQAQGPRA
ncbi:MAG: MerR family transcriptional regulator [Aquabacterium sp.]|jgi:methanogenic corrinoid protein MtbC1